MTATASPTDSPTADPIAGSIGEGAGSAPEPKRFWAYVELMGHKQLAGLLTEEQLGGTMMLRLDVPETTRVPAYTRYFNGGSVYGITPCTEATARAVAERVCGYTQPVPIAIGKSGDPSPAPARLAEGSAEEEYALDDGDDGDYEDDPS